MGGVPRVARQHTLPSRQVEGNLWDAIARRFKTVPFLPMIYAASFMQQDYLRYILGVMVSVLAGSTGCDRLPASAPAGVIERSASSKGVPTILADTQHELNERGASGKPYLVDAGSGLVVDASDFRLQDPQRRARFANTVQVIYDRSLFTAETPASGKQLYVLDRSTLRLVRGSAFGGFKSATQAYIAVGHTEAAGRGAAPKFTPFWMTSVVFR